MHMKTGQYFCMCSVCRKSDS